MSKVRILPPPKNRDVMKQELVKKVSKYIDTWRLLEPGELVLVAVSGGSDSVALGSILNQLASKYRLKQHWVHINHQMRPDSSEDVSFVRQLAERLRIPLSVETIEPTETALYQKRSIEEVARDLRFKVFERVAQQVGSYRIALAHHRDDQAETILMRIIRGCGMQGMTGMAPSLCWGKYRIIRPLLESTKKELQEWLSYYGVPWREDITNQNKRYFRNKIRHHLIPILEKSYNNKIQARIANLGSCLEADQEYLEECAQRIYDELPVRSENEIAVSLKGLLLLPKAMQRRVSRLAIAEIKGNTRGIDFRHWTELEDLYHFRPGRTIVHLPKGVIVQKFKGKVVFYRKEIHGREKKEEPQNTNTSA